MKIMAKFGNKKEKKKWGLAECLMISLSSIQWQEIGSGKNKHHVIMTDPHSIK